LSGIIKEGFRIKYCAEKLYLVGKNGSNAAHPMICFCDIPLSQSHEHFDSYGCYGIGLTKEWAAKIGVNPVLYISPDSHIATTIHSLLKERRKNTTNLTQQQKNEIIRIKCFAKNYSGQLKRCGKVINNYIFYNEREWRFIPSKECVGKSLLSVNLKNYNEDKDKYNNPLSKLRFEFEAEDVSYIIVEKTSEIPAIISVLRSKFGSVLAPEQVDILLSKICSTEQIKRDY
jgi:hypothetical protein